MYMYLPRINIYCLSLKILLSFKVFKNVFEGGWVITHCNNLKKTNYDSTWVLTYIRKLLLLIKGFHRHD